jgi:hypothetical protein
MIDINREALNLDAYHWDAHQFLPAQRPVPKWSVDHRSLYLGIGIGFVLALISRNW